MKPTRLRSGIRYLYILPWLCALPLLAQRPVDDDEILRYLDQTAAWYREASAVAQTPATSREALFADSLRQTSAQALRRAFDFGRAQAAIPSQRSNPAAPDSGRGRNLMQAEAGADQRVDALETQIEQINRELQTAPARSRGLLVARRDTLTGALNLAKTRRETLRGLVGFLASPTEGGLAAKIADLERLLPEAQAAPAQKTGGAPETGRPAALPDFHPESMGIVGLTTQIFSLSQSVSRLDHFIEATAALERANDKIREPLRAALRDVVRRGDAAGQVPDTADEEQLASQRKELDTLLARFKLLSGAAAPLGQQAAPLAASRSNVVEWRNSLRDDYRSALRHLLLRLGMLAMGIGVIFIFSELWRRGTMRYVQEIRRRRQLLVLRRIVVGCTIALFVVLSFVTEFGSLATFAGFSAAGIAIAMQSVIVSVVAYFFLVGRWGVRVGDRVTVSGVTGEVVDIGLFRMYLMELTADIHPTGRMVVFPNAIFFQPAAVFKQMPGVDYTWHTISLTVAPNGDYSTIEKRVLDAIDSVYQEYRESIERQHRTAQDSMNLQTATPRPESRFRFVDAGLEFVIRYPVEARRASEIDDRISRSVIDAIEKEPKLKFTETGAPRIRTQV